MTPEQKTALVAELAGDPENLGYSTHLPGSPGTVAELMNAPTQSMLQPLRSTTAKAWAAQGPMARIVDAAAKGGGTGGADHLCRASCLVVLESFRSGDFIHVELPDVASMLDAWVATGICTATERDDLLARAHAPASRAQVLGLPFLTYIDIIEAQS